MSDLVERIRYHIAIRGGPAKDDDGKYIGTTWPMMLEAVDEIEGLRLEHQHACQEISVAVEERDFLRAALVAVAAARMPGEARRIAVEALRVVVSGANEP